MDFTEYQHLAKQTAVYRQDDGTPRLVERTLALEHRAQDNLEDLLNKFYTILGLANEAGEAAGVVKKFLRGDYDYIIAREKIIKELGDVLWYLAMACEEWEISLSHVAIENLEKLRERNEKGTIKGDGDR